MSGCDFDLLVVGDVNPDVIVRDADPAFDQHEEIVSSIEMTIGGSASIMAMAAARLGLRVAIVGVVGDDPFGRFMLDELRGRGVDVDACRVDPERPTGATVILTRDSDRAILTAAGTIPDLTAEDVPPDLVRRARHLHVASYFLIDGLRDGLAAVARDAHESGATVSVDPNWDPREEWDRGLRGLLPVVDVFMPNEAEALKISGRSTIEAAADALVADGGCRIVAIKRGPTGAYGAGGTEAAVAIPAYPIAAVDAVGAGDAFDAAFLAAFLEGSHLRDGLRFGVVAGALSTRAAGGTAGQATREEIDAALLAGAP